VRDGEQAVELGGTAAVCSLYVSWGCLSADDTRNSAEAFHESAFVEVTRQLVAASVRVFLLKRPTLVCLVRRLPHRKEFRRTKLLTIFQLSVC